MKTQIKYLQNLFYDLINDYGQVYIVIKYSPNSAIGKRGFTEEEKKKGLVLVFNQKNYRNLEWDGDGNIITTLGFGAGNRPEKCFLYCDDIVSVFSSGAKVRFDRWDMLDIVEQPEESKEPAVTEEEKHLNEKIISLERFKKTKK